MSAYFSIRVPRSDFAQPSSNAFGAEHGGIGIAVNIVVLVSRPVSKLHRHPVRLAVPIDGGDIRGGNLWHYVTEFSRKPVPTLAATDSTVT